MSDVRVYAGRVHTTATGHRFAAIDVRRTVDHGADLLDEFLERHHPLLADRRARVIDIIRGIDVDHTDLDDLERVLDRVWDELLGARDDLFAAGALPGTATGQVVGLHLGDGGVPKAAVDRVQVDLGGVVGDRQTTRRHHGAPWQALCLWSVEVIHDLAADGHPIAAGSAGENVTIAGLPWADVVPGVRLRVGDALCEMSSYAVPCRQNARWFTDRRFDRIHYRHGPVSRVYATVLEPGAVNVGDEVVLEP